MDSDQPESEIRKKYDQISFCLNERGRRLWAAAEAKSYGRGGIALLVRATGMSNNTVIKGMQELNNPDSVDQRSIRRKGGGRKKAIEKQEGLTQDLEALVDPSVCGDPESPLRWTSKSVRKLTNQLQIQGHQICFKTTATLLKELGYSLQANKKTKSGSFHADRDKQFEYIASGVKKFHKTCQPVISVDTKKKENIGEFKNGGKEYCKKGQPVQVKDHDFPCKKLGKVVPYGVYDLGSNRGWVSVGISGDTAEFAVNAIRTWWYAMGSPVYKSANELLITADCGGSNGYRVRLWKKELQTLANETQLKITVRHFPPGTSKWNKIEHRMFSYISKNWRGKPLIDRETVVNLISRTETEKGLKIQAVLDENQYETGKKVTDKEMDALNIEGDDFHPEWNYTIHPHLCA
jgi:hypothetical protein